MPLLRVSSEPRMASGLDILSDMIRHVHRTNHLDISVFAPDQLNQTAAYTLIHAGRNLKSWLSPYRKKQLARGASEEDDVIMLEALLAKCLVFTMHQPFPMHRDYFWKSVHPSVGVWSQ